MPTYQVTIQGKTYNVEILDPHSIPLRVVVDGQPFDVGIAGAEPDADQVVSGTATTAQVANERGTATSRPSLPVRRGGRAITAPMPGTILSVEVEQGQKVDCGQVVCVLEAMKMRNPIRAGMAGTVVRILVETGHGVAYGDLLVEIS